MELCLKDFEVVRPQFEKKQEAILNWIVRAHAASERRHTNATDEESRAFSIELKEKLFKLGLGEEKIQKRGFQIDDCHHENWEEMEIYNVEDAPEGYFLSKRMEFYEKASSLMFETLYPKEVSLPPHLVHVTCTGYVAPSPAQKLVSKRSQGPSTMVTHAYHMGCYGSIPAIRMGMGHAFAEKKPTDIVHTEFCSLHMNPNLHTTEQLVVQSLFADGVIKYRVCEVDDSPSLQILAVLEEVIQDSSDKMTWICNDWGFKMTIAKEVPVLIRNNLSGYLERLAKKAGVDPSQLESATYAIHPGGPKIIEQIAKSLSLSDEQIEHSKAILKECGNMSSATLPHVWERMIRDEKVPEGELIVSLAFGPGLSISGALFQKR